MATPFGLQGYASNPVPDATCKHTPIYYTSDWTQIKNFFCAFSVRLLQFQAETVMPVPNRSLCGCYLLLLPSHLILPFQYCFPSQRCFPVPYRRRFLCPELFRRRCCRHCRLRSRRLHHRCLNPFHRLALSVSTGLRVCLLRLSGYTWLPAGTLRLFRQPWCSSL